MKKLLLLGCALFALSFVAQAGLVNGTFDTGDLTGWTLFTTANGLTGSSGSGVSSFDTTGSGASNAATFEVGQAVFASGGPSAGGGIYQLLTLAAGSVTFSLDWAAFNSNNPSYSNASGGEFRLLLDGTSIASTTVGQILGQQTIRGSLSGTSTVSAGSHEIRIEITRPWTTIGSGLGTTPYQYIDNVVALQDSAVPEPATWIAVLGGLGLLAAYRRRAERG